jgi:hypothetical protein
MASDSGKVLQQSNNRDIRRLPDVVSLQIQRRHFDPPRRVTLKGVDHFYSDAVQIEVAVSEPFIIRALGPALWIGDEALTAMESASEKTYRFFSFTPEVLKDGADISLSWNAPHPERKQTKYQYASP